MALSRTKDFEICLESLVLLALAKQPISSNEALSDPEAHTSIERAMVDLEKHVKHMESLGPSRDLIEKMALRVAECCFNLFVRHPQTASSESDVHGFQLDGRDPVTQTVFLTTYGLEFCGCFVGYSWNKEDEWYVEEARALKSRVHSVGFYALSGFFNCDGSETLLDHEAEMVIRYLKEEWPQSLAITSRTAKRIHKAIVASKMHIQYRHISQFVTAFSHSKMALPDDELKSKVREWADTYLEEPSDPFFSSCKVAELVMMRFALRWMVRSGTAAFWRSNQNLHAQDTVSAEVVQRWLDKFGFPGEGVSSPLRRLITELLIVFGGHLNPHTGSGMLKMLARYCKIQLEYGPGPGSELFGGPPTPYVPAPEG